ncbi:hypothetical protein ACLB0R_11030 [Sphingomonas sp. GlSt437]|uniref:hypothetical protein n=1 Tax=Sphingomonas sp. GlSt437 TaxID=3389970 RepID=UPI003A881BC4
MSAARPALALIALLALGACGSTARNEAGEAGSTVAADPNATMAEAVRDVDAAGDKALGGNEADVGNASAAIGNADSASEDQE